MPGKGPPCGLWSVHCRAGARLDSLSQPGVKWRDVKIRELMQEYDLEIDDLRWYLSIVQAERLLSYREKKRELARLIWSGSLENELYDMEERFLAELQNRLEGGSRDEIQVREILKEIVASRDKRYTQS